LDTSRNYYPFSDLRRLVDAMSINKLNVFHWHMTDTHSFPYQSRLRPEMAADGAYSAQEVYTMTEIREFVDYARLRGVKVIPELDAPAHSGNGWRWGPQAGLGDMVWCANREPWYEWCVEPPCGQLNPLNDNVYDVSCVIFPSSKLSLNVLVIFCYFYPDLHCNLAHFCLSKLSYYVLASHHLKNYSWICLSFMIRLI
jgi:hexosaminidase